MNRTELGRAAYEEWCFQGLAVNPWNDLKKSQQEAWCEVGEAVGRFIANSLGATPRHPRPAA